MTNQPKPKKKVGNVIFFVNSSTRAFSIFLFAFILVFVVLHIFVVPAGSRLFYNYVLVVVSVVVHPVLVQYVVYGTVVVVPGKLHS